MKVLNNRLFDIMGQRLKAGDLIVWAVGDGYLSIGVVKTIVEKDLEDYNKKPIRVVKPNRKWNGVIGEVEPGFFEHCVSLSAGSNAAILHPHFDLPLDEEQQELLKYQAKYRTI